MFWKRIQEDEQHGHRQKADTGDFPRYRAHGALRRQLFLAFDFEKTIRTKALWVNNKVDADPSGRWDQQGFAHF